MSVKPSNIYSSDTMKLNHKPKSIIKDLRYIKSDASKKVKWFRSLCKELFYSLLMYTHVSVYE